MQQTGWVLLALQAQMAPRERQLAQQAPTVLHAQAGHLLAVQQRAEKHLLPEWGMSPMCAATPELTREHSERRSGRA